MLSIEFELQRSSRVTANPFVHRMEGFERRAGDMSPALEQVYKSFLKTERGLFASQGGTMKWAPLTPRYLARKTRRGLDSRVMRATGELYQALGLGQGSGAVKSINTDGATFGTNLQKAVYAHRGSGRRRRRLIVADRMRRSRWTKLIEAYLVQGQVQP